jgi:hypothetical protein
MQKSIRCHALNMACLALMIGTVLSCKSGTDKTTDKELVAEGEASQTEAAIEQATGYPLPTTFDVTKMLNEAGAAYILSISNPASNVGNYFTQTDKALNLGVYGADLSYASTYMMQQETMLYLKATKQLTDEIEISSAFNQTYVERVENNLENGDSLINIISESFEDTYNYLTNNNNDKLAILVVTGSWIEGLYITAQIAVTAADNTTLLDIIVHQKSSLKKLLELLEPLQEDEDVAEIIASLQKLKEEYDAVEDQITPEQFENIFAIVEALRNTIV